MTKLWIYLNNIIFLCVMIIFLDIDGVMVPAKSWVSPEILNDGFPAFSSHAIRALQQILSEDTIVILTTSHKSNYTILEWKTIFKNRGITINHLQSLPENKNNLSRKVEILNWFEINKIHDPFLIIDDDKSLNDLPISIKENLILTSSMLGLTEKHIEGLIQ